MADWRNCSAVSHRMSSYVTHSSLHLTQISPCPFLSYYKSPIKGNRFFLKFLETVFFFVSVGKMASKELFVCKAESIPFVALDFSYSTVSNILIGTFATICAVYLLKSIETCLYRVYFDQLSHIPGPRLAAASKLWWVYNNVFPHGGKLVFKLPELHKKYGPVVRISPTEVTVHDIDSYHE